MLAIILSACMIDNPTVCKDYKITMDEASDQTSCAVYAAPYFIPWTEEHPGWQIKKWRCAPVSEDNI
ncbi:MAG: hypothetical protein ACRCS9_11580 [Hyphomicrobium sp.]